MNLNFAKSNPNKQFEINGQNNTNTNPATQEIQGALTKASSLSDCLSSIQSIIGYLSDESKEVKDMAAKTIVSLVGKAVGFLSKENNPDTIQKASVKLLGVIQQLNQNGSISLGADEKSKLDNCKKIIVEKLANATKDRFASSGQPSSSDDKLASSSLNQTINNLSGGMNENEVVSSLNKIKGGLIGVA